MCVYEMHRRKEVAEELKNSWKVVWLYLFLSVLGQNKI